MMDNYQIMILNIELKELERQNRELKEENDGLWTRKRRLLKDLTILKKKYKNRMRGKE